MRLADAMDGRIKRGLRMRQVGVYHRVFTSIPVQLDDVCRITVTSNAE